jgi:putative oxidoreductase
MVIGAALVNLPNGLFMNWTGQQKGEGFEFHILAVALLIALMTKGAGPLSIDRAFSRK